MRTRLPSALSVAALTLAMAFIVTACQSSSPGSSAQPSPSASTADDTAAVPAADESAVAAAPGYRARGNEPGWLAIVDGNNFTLDARYGELKVSGPVPDVAPDAEGARTWGPAIEGIRVTLSARRGPCRDSMSGMVYPDHVVLTLDDDTLSGCGGEPRDLLVGDTWRIEAIDGQATLAESAIDIAFDDGGRAGGAGSCNRYSAGYTLSGEGLNFGPVTSTLMACDQPLMDQEQRLHDALARVGRFDIGDDGALLLLAGDDKVAVRAVR